MKTTFALLLMLMLGGALPSVLNAQTVWRCGADGRTFTDAPCLQGQPLEAVTSRPAADLHNAQQRAQREQTWADQLQRERQQRELQATAGPAGIYGLRPVKALPEPKVKVAKKHPKQRFEAADTWRSTAPSTRQKKG